MSTISIQQTTNNWHKLCHWQYSNSTFSPPVSHAMSPPSLLSAVWLHTMLSIYYLSALCIPFLMSPLLGGIDVVRCMIGPLSSPLSIWQLCLAPDIIEEAGHYPAPQCPHIIVITRLPQYWSPPSHQGWNESEQWSPQPSLLIITGPADIRFLSRGERGRRHFDDDKLVSFCQSRRGGTVGC